MPRTPRWSLPGVLYHCIWEFVDKTWFIQHAEERERYLFLLGRALKRSDWRCLAYAVMSNHIHIAAVAGHRPMSSWTLAVNSPFAGWLNQRHRRLGPVFADRAKDHQVRPAREGAVIAYIHNNPVEAGVVGRARDSRWTSHRAYVGLDPAPDWLDVGEGLGRAGFVDRNAFDAWVDVTPGESGEVDVERTRTRLRRRGALLAGTPLANGSDVHVPVFARRNGHVRPDPGRIIEIVAELCDVAVALLCSRRRIPEAVDARILAAHCARETGVTTGDLAAAFGLTPQAVCSMTRRAIPESLRVTYDGVLARVMTELWGAAA